MIYKLVNYGSFRAFDRVMEKKQSIHCFVKGIQFVVEMQVQDSHTIIASSFELLFGTTFQSV